MVNPSASEKTLTAWVQVPHAMATAIEGLTDDGLDLRGGPHDWSIRETVHHLVEANLVASNVVIAGMADSGCTYDWSWVTPDELWMQTMGYSTAPVRYAIETLRFLCRYVSDLIRTSSDAPTREVKLLDAPEAELRVVTVEEVIRGEVDHALVHLREVAETRKRYSR